MPRDLADLDLENLALALEAMDQAPRRVLILARRDGLDDAAIANELGIPVERVRQHLFAALLHLALAVREERVTLSIRIYTLGF